VFKFSVNPAAITVTEGIQHAFGYLGESWRKWLPFVVVLGIAQFIVYLALGSVSSADIYTTDPYTGRMVLASDATARITALFWVSLLSVAVSTVVGWGFTGIAISGLRGTPLTPAWLVNRGIIAFLAEIVVLVVSITVVIVTIVVILVTLGVGALALFIAIPVGVYLAIRYTAFSTLAIFDGFGVIDGFRESWRLSQSAVLRIIGWGLMSVLISIGFSIVTLPLAIFGAVGSGLSGGVQGVYSAFAVFFMAALYESQRARHDPTLYPFAPGYGVPPAGPYPGYPGYPQSPYGAGAYPAGPYAPGAAPQWPPAQQGAPQWPAPQWPPAQAGAPQWPPQQGAPQWPPAQAGAPQWPPAPAPLWVSSQPEPGQPPAAPQPNVPTQAPEPNQLGGQAEQPPAKPRRTRKPPETPGS
jgi:hypothetical protein